MGFYSQAIDAKPSDPVLLDSLFLNRAVCNLELSEPQPPLSEHPLMIAENYGSVLRDCSKVLSTNQGSLKALYRSALALIALQRPIEALDCCERGLRIDPDSDGLKGTQAKAQKLKEEQDVRERMKVEKLEAKKRDEERLARALKASQLALSPLNLLSCCLSSFGISSSFNRLLEHRPPTCGLCLPQMTHRIYQSLSSFSTLNTHSRTSFLHSMSIRFSPSTLMSCSHLEALDLVGTSLATIWYTTWCYTLKPGARDFLKSARK